MRCELVGRVSVVIVPCSRFGGVKSRDGEDAFRIGNGNEIAKDHMQTERVGSNTVVTYICIGIYG